MSGPALARTLWKLRLFSRNASGLKPRPNRLIFSLHVLLVQIQTNSLPVARTEDRIDAPKGDARCIALSALGSL